VFGKLATWLTFVAFAGTYVVAFASGGAVAVAVIGVGAIAVSVSVAFSGTVAVVVAFACTFAIAFVVGNTVAGPVAFAFGGAFGVAVAVAFAVAFGVAVAGTLAVAFAGAIGKSTANGWGGRAYVGLVLLLLAGGIGAVVITPADRPLAFLALLTFGLLPVVNAVFDWLSYGVTIWLLSRGHRRFGALLSALADLTAALFLFAGLSATLVLLFGLIDQWRGEVLINVGALLSGLRDQPQENWWVVAMVGSTLLPTLIHLALGFVSVVTWARAGVWNALLARFDEQHGPDVMLPVTFLFSVLLVAYVLVPVFLIYGAGLLIWEYGGVVRDFYVGWLIDLAVWAGFMEQVAGISA
jgi:hypothetical protein